MHAGAIADASTACTRYMHVDTARERRARAHAHSDRSSTTTTILFPLLLLLLAWTMLCGRLS